MNGLVGPVVDGIVTGLQDGGGDPSTGPVYAGPEYDVSLGGLGFNLWPDTERPYERATAKFRKDQLDVGQSAGDQSLVGYWTRGQFSFHKGAGIKYYEVLAGDAVIDRFDTSLGVDPFSKVGELSLSKEWSAQHTANGFVDAVPATYFPGGPGAVIGRTSTGALLAISETGAVTPVSTSDGGAVAHMDSNGEFIYAANGNRIETQNSPDLERWNYLPSPMGYAGYSIANPPSGTLNNPPGWTRTGGPSGTTVQRGTFWELSVFAPGTAWRSWTTGPDMIVKQTATGLSVGQPYRITAMVQAGGGPTSQKIFFFAGSTEIDLGNEVANLIEKHPDTYHTTAYNGKVFVNFEVVADASSMDVGFRVTSGGWDEHVPNSSQPWTMIAAQKMMLTRVPVLPLKDWSSSPYFDPWTTEFPWRFKFGSTTTWSGGVGTSGQNTRESYPDYRDGFFPGWEWEGAPYFSRSRRTAANSTTLVPCVYHSEEGAKFLGVWYAKGRVFMVDNRNRWFAAPVSVDEYQVDDQSTFWRAPYRADTVNKWVVTETEGPLLAARAGTIYAITIGDDGTVVSLEAPAVAATLPAGEEICSMGEWMGQVILATTRGIRVAELAGNNLRYGPLLCEGVGTFGARMALKGDVVLVPLTVEGSRLLMSVSLSTAIIERVWPYAARDVVSGAAPYGAGSSSTGQLFLYSGAGLHRESANLVPSGWVQTGFHRFGTLEKKKFQSVTVRVGGQGGSLRVTRVYVDGSEAPLHQFNVEEFSSVDIDLREDEPLELLGLRFTLERDPNDPTVGPIFQGYQLRALPAPKRERMIRLPLMLFDSERNATTGRPTGSEGSAWRRLSALEEMESSGGTFMFWDRRTDEIGEVFIESVEHVGVTSPKARTSGFGGMLYVTLRKLN